MFEKPDSCTHVNENVHYVRLQRQVNSTLRIHVVSVKGGLSLKIKQQTYSPVLHIHTVLMKQCPCKLYRQYMHVIL